MSRGKAKTTTRIEVERVRRLNGDEPRSKGQYVLYWMQQSQRAEHNPALEYGVQQANEHDQRLLVVVGLRATTPGKDSTGLSVRGLDPSPPLRLLDRLKLDRSVAPNPLFRGGTREARRPFPPPMAFHSTLLHFDFSASSADMTFWSTNR